jgi:methionyl-tRNA synthetase
MERILIGVAWPYANGPQHIGHLAGNLLPADIFARYQRLKGSEVLMVSGSDMHGTPTTVQAEKEGVSPEKVAERYHTMNMEAFHRLGISFDLYTHTHTLVHKLTVQEVFLTLLEKRYLEKRTEEYPYCEKHKRFLPDRYVTGTCPYCGSESARGDGCDVCSKVLEPKDLKTARCKVCDSPAVFLPSEHFYFMLPKLSKELKEYHDKVKGHWRPSVRAFTENYLAGGLIPRPITRDMQWGVPIPLEEYDSKRIYVWFEAVIGYLSASREWAIRQGDPERWKRFWLADEPVRMYNFLGKDNITFHTILWPAILMAIGGLQLPYDVPANEFMVVGGKKLSKSRMERDETVPLYLPDLLARFDPDVIRFYSAYHMPQNHDTEFSFDELSHDRDQLLADQWGNLVQRVLSFVSSNYGGKVPSPRAGWDPENSATGKAIRIATEEVARRMDAVELKEALDVTLGLVREANRTFHEAKPWASQGDARDTTIYEALWSIKTLTVLLAPYIPFSSEKVARMLNAPDLLKPGRWAEAAKPPTPGAAIGKMEILFPKQGKEAKPEGAKPDEKAGDAPLDIRIGLILEVAAHPNAERLYVMKIDLGEAQPRTIVAGLKTHYKPEELLGRSIAVLTNLAPRALRGVTSQGMILAASSGEDVAIIGAKAGTPPGTALEGSPPSSRTITYDEFSKVKLVVVKPTPQAGDELVVIRMGPGDVQTPLVLATGSTLYPQRKIAEGARVQ